MTEIDCFAIPGNGGNADLRSRLRGSLDREHAPDADGVLRGLPLTGGIVTGDRVRLDAAGGTIELIDS